MKKISLDAPKRGDVVTRYEFDEIQKIKTEEMKVRFQNNRNSGGGNFRMKNTK
jgi:NAD-dependent DNA ligase